VTERDGIAALFADDLDAILHAASPARDVARQVAVVEKERAALAAMRRQVVTAVERAALALPDADRVIDELELAGLANWSSQVSRRSLIGNTDSKTAFRP
jgi:hypothetical protein